PEPAQPIALGLPVERRVDDRRPEAVPRERVHLVLHERDERAHDEHGAGDEARGYLEGERLARAGRHDADAVASREHGRDDLLLPRAKLGVAEDAGQDVAGSEAGRERELIDAGRGRTTTVAPLRRRTSPSSSTCTRRGGARHGREHRRGSPPRLAEDVREVLVESRMTTDLRVVADGFHFLEGPRWRDGRLWV